MLNAVTAVRNARAAWETSVVARKLYDQTTAGVRRKYELGTDTILDVVIAQRDDTARQLAEQDALNQLQRARGNLGQTLGRTLEEYNVNLEESEARHTVARELEASFRPRPPSKHPPAQRGSSKAEENWAADGRRFTQIKRAGFAFLIRVNLRPSAA